MWFYNKVYKPENTASLVVPPLFLWLVICGVIAFKLKGASFFIIPVYFGLLSLFILVRQKRPSIILMALLLFPVLTMLVPFVKMFPVALGLKTIIATTLLVSLIFSLCISVVGFSRYKDRWSYVLFFLALCCFVAAHFQSDFNNERPKPNSLVYLMDADNNSALWGTYDHVLDDWTKAYLTDNPDKAKQDNTFASKYKTGFSYTKKANVKPLKLPYIDIQTDTVINAIRHVKLFITSQREVNQLEFFADSTNNFFTFNINGLEVHKEKNQNMVFDKRENNHLFGYYVTDKSPLVLDFTVPLGQKTDLQMYEASFDMLDNDLFRIPKRPDTMIPKPFVVNDAVIIKKTIRIE